ncbi:hypothetical protein IFM89_006305, partial [Coptis chinensis]
MSGEEGVPTETAAPVLSEPMDIMTALQLVLKRLLAHDGLARGIHEGHHQLTLMIISPLNHFPNRIKSRTLSIPTSRAKSSRNPLAWSSRKEPIKSL